MKEYQITLVVKSTDFSGPPDWIISEVRDSVTKMKGQVKFASIEAVEKEND